MTLIKVTDLNKKGILENLNFEIAPGIVAVLGENGAGKTTLFDIIAGLRKNYLGTIAVNGKAKLADRKMLISYVPSFKYISRFTTFKKLAKDFSQIYPDVDQARLNEMVEFFQIDQSENLAKASKGTIGKWKMALCFSRKVPVYLLDEPFNGIDVITRKKIMNSILLWKPEESVILLTDHYFNEISSILDHILIINHQKLVAQADVEDIREQGKSIEDFYIEQLDE
ncbi:MAG: ATP-binding cassette domain-containing protein [Lactobacillus sp.]|nr:ATP-binding cassette domain-containing protein [Lactobacillus sp.]